MHHPVELRWHQGDAAMDFPSTNLMDWDAFHLELAVLLHPMAPPPGTPTNSASITAIEPRARPSTDRHRPGLRR
jgi:hypothetical protein